MPRPIEPRPLKQHQLKTVLLRVPTGVWPVVSTGRVREFRAATGNAPQLWKVPTPTLAVCFRRRPTLAEYDYRLMVLEGVRQERLGAVTGEGLAAAGYEGQDALARFRRDWMISEKRRFEPLRMVFVYTVRPVDGASDLLDLGSTLVDHLYGDYLDQDAHLRPKTIRADQGNGREREAVPAGSR